jgi:hypothetical protein
MRPTVLALAVTLAVVVAGGAAAATYRGTATGTITASGIPGVPTGLPLTFSYDFDPSAAVSGSNVTLVDLSGWSLSLAGQQSVATRAPGFGIGQVRVSGSLIYQVIGQNGVPPIEFSGAFGTATLNGIAIQLENGPQPPPGGGIPTTIDPSEWATSSLLLDFGSFGALVGTLDSLSIQAVPEPSLTWLGAVALAALAARARR